MNLYDGQIVLNGIVGTLHLLPPNSSSLSPFRALFQLRKLSIGPWGCLEGDMILASLSDRTSQFSEVVLVLGIRPTGESGLGAGLGSEGLEVSLDRDNMSPGPGVFAGAGRYMGRPGVRVAATRSCQLQYRHQSLLTYNLAVCGPNPSSDWVSGGHVCIPKRGEQTHLSIRLQSMFLGQ
jgi:hypothetical protein